MQARGERDQCGVGAPPAQNHLRPGCAARPSGPETERLEHCGEAQDTFRRDQRRKGRQGELAWQQ